MANQSAFRHIIFVMLATALASCAQSPNKMPPPQKDPLKQTVKIRQPNPDPSVNQPTQVVEKRLINIVIDNQALSANGVKISSINKLKQLLKDANSPVITIAAHKCSAAEKTSEIMSIAQEFTTTPIAYKSYGNYEDPQCE